MSKIKISELECRPLISSMAILSILDISGQEKEIEKLSPKALFFGTSDEKIPEDLKLKEWDEMEYIEPLFIFP